jgi:hypothetical protein
MPPAMVPRRVVQVKGPAATAVALLLPLAAAAAADTPTGAHTKS